MFARAWAAYRKAMVEADKPCSHQAEGRCDLCGGRVPGDW